MVNKKQSDKDFAKSFSEKIVSSVNSGALDGFLNNFDQAVTERIKAVGNVKGESKPGRKSSAKTPPKPLIRPEKTSSTFDSSKLYRLVSPAPSKFVGAKVRHVRTDTERNKEVVEVMVGKSGLKKGKKVFISSDSLVEVKSRKN